LKISQPDSLPPSTISRELLEACVERLRHEASNLDNETNTHAHARRMAQKNLVATAKKIEKELEK